MKLRRMMWVGTGVAVMASWLAWALAGMGPGEPRREPASESAGRDLAAAPVDMTVSPDEVLRQAAVRKPGPRGCTIEPRYLANGDGTVTEVLACEPNQPVPAHDYERYPSEALEALAYSDPDAAAVLSLRWRYADAAAAMSMAVRAAALAGGDATPIVAFSNAYPEPTAVDDQPVQETVRVKYVLGAVTKLLGDPRHGVPYFEAVIREHSQDPDREIALLDQRARELFDEMRRIQMDVTGSSTIGG